MPTPRSPPRAVSCFGFWRASTASFHFVTLRGGDFRDGRVDSNGRLELTKRLELSPSAEMLASTLNKHLLVALTLDFTEGSILLSFETEDVDGAPQEDEIGDGEQDSDPVVHARYRILQEAEVEQALATLHWQGGHCRPS